MKKIICILAVLLLVLAGCTETDVKQAEYAERLKTKVNDYLSEEDAAGSPEANINSSEALKEDIIEIPIDNISGITPEKATELCFSVMGEKDKETGFAFSFGVSGAVETKGKQYYVIRGSWLVNNSHLSYIGDFFVSADGKEIYSGTYFQGEYTMDNVIWSE